MADFWSSVPAVPCRIPWVSSDTPNAGAGRGPHGLKLARLVIVPRGRESGCKGAVRRAVLRSPFKGTVLVFSLDRLAIIEARYFGRRQDGDTGRGIHAGLGVLCRGGRRVVFSSRPTE